MVMAVLVVVVVVGKIVEVEVIVIANMVAEIEVGRCVVDLMGVVESI